MHILINQAMHQHQLAAHGGDVGHHGAVVVASGIVLGSAHVTLCVAKGNKKREKGDGKDGTTSRKEGKVL